MSRTESTAGGKTGEPLVILIPVYDDWAAAEQLLVALDQTLARDGKWCDVLLVDDGSLAPCPASIEELALTAVRCKRILKLRRNLGHQRAIAVGLAYVEEHVPCSAVVVMDGDGEDAPADVPRLLDCCAAGDYRKIVFAGRAERSESVWFRLFYLLYQFLHRLLTGQQVRVGNFSVIPKSRLGSLVAVSELWNHYPAAAFKSRQPCTTLPCRRAPRIEGQSRMGFLSLVIHGLSSMSVYADLLSARLLLASSLLIVMASLGIVGAVAIRLFTRLAIPGWATYTAGLLLVILLQMIMFSAVLGFVILNSRQGTTVIPARDYRHFVWHARTLGPRQTSESV